MNGRIICAIGCLLLASAVCGARQEPVSLQQASVLPAPVSSPEMDALAGKLAERIAKDKAKTVVVVGGATSEIVVNRSGGKGPVMKVTDLGVALRDGLSDSLARQAKHVRVISGAELRALLRQSRVSQAMVCDDGLGDWIAALVHADAVVTMKLDRVENGRAIITAQLFDERQQKVYDTAAKSVVPFASFEGKITLTETQANSVNQEYHAALSFPDAKFETATPRIPKCVACKNPDYNEEARKLRIQGPVAFLITIRPDGMADDITVTRSIGHGLDGKAVESILTWLFHPNVDAEGRPVAARVEAQVVFQLF